MTGYGRGEAAQDGFKITVEISSVNRKQMEIALHLPRDLEVLEAQMRDEINQRVGRGRLTVRLSFHAAASSAARSRVNTNLAKAYARDLRALAKTLQLKDDLTLDLIARAPGVLQAEEQVQEAEAFWPGTARALKSALDQLLKMRQREGGCLASDLEERITRMRAAVERVQRLAPQVADNYREQLLTRIKNAGLDLPAAQDERLLKEVFYFADRADVTEELTRLQSHFQQFDHCLKAREPIGRTLDFLAQEMNREINTLGTKASDSRISREVVQLKAELEKFREQVQNVE